MAENLVKPYGASEIRAGLVKNLGYFTKFGPGEANTQLHYAIANLEKMKKDALSAESRIYSLLNVTSLEELQGKLDVLNQLGLQQLSNKVLSKMPLMITAREGYVSLQDLQEGIENSFLEYLKKEKTIENLSEVAEEEAMEVFRTFEREVLGVKHGSLIKGVGSSKKSKSKKALVKLANGFELEFTKSRKRDISKRLKIKSKTAEVAKETYMGTTLTLLIEEKGQKYLTYYPYFALTPEEREDAKKDKDLWEAFVDAVSSCVGGVLQTEVALVMKEMGCEAFVDTGSNANDIVGIFGELQGLVFLHHLGIHSKRSPQFLGHALNEKKQKVGVDLAFESIGFQVKNYSMYGEDEGFQLNGSYTLANFADIISDSYQNPALDKKLEWFYTISAYHTLEDKNFKGTRLELDRLGQEVLPSLYHGAIGNLLPLKRITWYQEQGEQLVKGGVSRNAFYIVGGVRILPVSTILSSYIDYLQNLTKEINVRKMLTMVNKDGIDYKGNTYKDYLQDQNSFKGYSEIAKNINIKYRMNFYLGQHTIANVMSNGIYVK